MNSRPVSNHYLFKIEPKLLALTYVAQLTRFSNEDLDVQDH